MGALDQGLAARVAWHAAPSVTGDVLASSGLLIDAIGAIWIVKSVIAATDDELRHAASQTAVYGAEPTYGSAMYGGGSRGEVYPRPGLMRILRASRRDAKIGGALLVVGFILQFLARWS